ncbi:MAG: hypothetical protein R3266_12115 [Gemmatimonadota bacterium]|nr:hypothetical protein [Gemmatimonadota bacterium]
MISRTTRSRGLQEALLIGLGAAGWACAPADDANAAATQSEAGAEMEALKGYLVNAFERAKAWDLALTEAMPDSALHWAPSSDVRDFGAQIVHAANVGFIGNALFGEAGPQLDEEVESKAALTEGVANSYDWVITRLQAMPAGDLETEVDFFGGQVMPRWRVATFALEHAMWTRGQVVPYLHAHGAEIPQNQLF